jgi:hypothetical protein
LIDINQTLSTDLTAPSSASSSGASTQAVAATSKAGSSATPVLSAQSPHPAASAAGSPPSTTPSAPTAHLSGNLSIPKANSAAERVGHALTRPTHAAAAGGIPLANQ